MPDRFGISVVVSALLLVMGTSHATAAMVAVSAEPGALARSVQEAQPGDVLRLLPGAHIGPIVIDKSLTLDGAGKAHVIGSEKGSVITVTATDVTLKGLHVSGSGSSGEHRDAGILLTKKAHNARVLNNKLTGNLVGVDVRGARDALVVGNIIEGRRGHRMNSRGNGVYVWNAPGAKVNGNDIRWGRDGIFVNTSRDNEFRSNRLRDLRFAIHYMYAHDSTVADNISIGNHLGYALMFSKNVKVLRNLSSGDRDYGLMLNYTNSSEITGNRVERIKDRCVFIYNAHKNNFSNNRFESCGIGVHFTAGSERNQFTSNAFIGNRIQVKYVGSRWLDWGEKGVGNFWSDHAAYDLNRDGIADALYRPNDRMDKVLWTQPDARSLLGSPAVQLIRWVLAKFPALTPGGLVDSHPLMQPVDPVLKAWKVLK